MTYELAKKLLDARYPMIKAIPDSRYIWGGQDTGGTYYEYPELSELIEACGDGFNYLTRGFGEDKWFAGKSKQLEDVMIEGKGSTPEEAVANLWLSLQEIKK